MSNKECQSTCLVIGLIIGFILALIFVLMFLVINIKSVEHIIKIIAYPFIAGSAVVALLKYKQDNAWNKKNLAYEKISVFIKELEEYRLKIDTSIIKEKAIENDNGDIISFTDRKRTNIPLTHDEVHQWVCQDHQVSSELQMCSMTEEGAKIIRNFLSIINIYELIAIGIKNEMLDKALVKESLEHVIIKNFEFFKPYIDHRRTKHDDTTLGDEWELLYKEFKR
jgi:hypothetical protein